MGTRGSLRIISTDTTSRWYYITSGAGDVAKRTLTNLVRWANKRDKHGRLPNGADMERHLKGLSGGHRFELTGDNGAVHPFAEDREGRLSVFNEYEYIIEPYKDSGTRFGWAGYALHVQTSEEIRAD